MQPLEVAIMRTVLYASVFKFALRITELHAYLKAEKPYSLDAIQCALDESRYLQSHLIIRHDYLVLRTHPEWIKDRIQRETLTLSLWQSATRYGRLFSYLPFVRMVALTGSLSARNPTDQDDDFDYLLVTEPGRVWVARIFAVLLVRLGRLQGRELCPNYIVASNRLAQSRQDIFLAHELAQMTPITGYPLYFLMLEENDWVRDYLPNAMVNMRFDRDAAVESQRYNIQRALEFFLNGRIGQWLETWEYKRKMKRFRKQYTLHLDKEDSESIISDQEVKGHFSEHGQHILNQYHAYLEEYQLA